MRRKFLIEYPDLDWLNSNPLTRKLDVIETYLKAPEGSTYHIKQTGENGHWTAVATKKIRQVGVKSLELERRLTEDHYLELLEEADHSLRSLYKTRYFLAYDRQYFVIDLFPFWHDQAILSVQIPSEDAEIRFPEEIHVIKEITDVEEYRNHYLAKCVA